MTCDYELPLNIHVANCSAHQSFSLVFIQIPGHYSFISNSFMERAQGTFMKDPGFINSTNNPDDQ